MSPERCHHSVDVAERASQRDPEEVRLDAASPHGRHPTGLEREPKRQRDREPGPGQHRREIHVLRPFPRAADRRRCGRVIHLRHVGGLEPDAKSREQLRRLRAAERKRHGNDAERFRLVRGLRRPALLRRGDGRKQEEGRGDDQPHHCTMTRPLMPGCTVQA